MIYYIYEIPGIKNGATMQWDKRSQQNFDKHGSYPIIIETMEGPNTPEYWQVVGDREWELANLNGYPKGQHYRVAREQRYFNHTTKSKAKISAAQKGRVKSQQERDNMSVARKGVPLTFDVWNKGIKTGPLKEDHKNKISNKLKGKNKTLEHNKNVSLALRTTNNNIEELILNDRSKGLSQNKLAEKYNLGRAVIRRIIKHV